MATILKQASERNRRYPRPVDPHGCESFGEILRKLRGEAESAMTAIFDHPLSLKIDFLVAAEGRVVEDPE